MFKLLKHLFDNNYINSAGLLALVLSPVADGLGGGIYFWCLFGILFSLFLFGVFDEYRRNKKLHSETIHIPIVIKVDDGPSPTYVMKNILDQIEQSYNLSNYEKILKRYLGINIEGYIFEYNGSIYDFDRAMSFARIIRYSVINIEKRFNGRVKFHVAYYKRPSIGFLLGTIFRTEAVVVYQNNDFENRFYPVANISSRAYKERIANFSKYSIQKHIQDTEEKSVLIAIESSSHKINLNANSIRKYKNIISINLIHNGTIPYDDNWIEYASEIYNVINQTQTEFDTIVIAHAMPEAIAMVLGMAIENYWNIDVLQYDNSDYKFILNMGKISYYF